MKLWSTAIVAGVLLATSPSVAEEANFTFGGDQYTAGQQAGIETDVARDAFIAGYNVSITAPVGGDAHLAGFNVSTSAPVTGDVYGAGYSVSVGAPVSSDVSLMGNNVIVQARAPVTGNARLVGQTVTIDAPIGGSVLVTAQTLLLNATIAGDLSFTGENVVFAPTAEVTGKVAIQAPKPIDVPATVADANRVTFTELVNPDYVGEAGRTAENVIKGFWPVFWAAVGWLAFLFVLGAALIALAPTRLRAMEAASEKRPFRTFGLGILTFASTLGLVIVAALTIIGLIALPFVLIYIAIACSLAYLTGAYVMALRIAGAFVAVDSNLKRLGVLAAGLVAAALLGMIPVLGWLITLAIDTFGFGVFAVVTMVHWSAKDAERIRRAEQPTVGSAGQPAA